MTLNNFSDFNMPKVIRFGSGSFCTLPDEVENFHPKKVAIISDKGLEKAGLVKRVIDSITPLGVSIVTFTDLQGEPTFKLVGEVVNKMKMEGCELIIGIGGGSALDVAKATAALMDKDDFHPYLSGESVIEFRTVPCILLPTTSGTGSEVTMNAIFGDEEQEVKRGIISCFLLPDVSIVDPALTLSCPARVTAASGVDAFTHAIESYVATNATLLTKMYAEKAMKLFAPNIHRAVHNGNKDLEARDGMSWVSLLGGISLANAGVGAVHALAYPLGGKYKIEHGVANALLLPYVFEVTGKTCSKEMVQIARFLQLGDYDECPHKAVGEVVNFLYELLGQLDLPSSLSDLGVEEESLPLLADQASKVDRLLSNTPYTLSRDKILDIYQNAYHGSLLMNNRGVR
ncbi:iron-containing alcohol dehydrogenase [Halobacillus naozhouensis]|uniref:Iron-containing alcohol dehydrogenase n=1 Tax=Halobacillus naozhouensis TaxID=554880 RepID=A0ABY8J3P6_9BACI|nr:iron-containing alcohol dehydrogenase [Halobacillus naozhouensis]WFT75566.1 iron-containing alcohol dehydrogenase [Halobacillus naozhouensis]